MHVGGHGDPVKLAAAIGAVGKQNAVASASDNCSRAGYRS
jgi:hypothetical protein